eukprot:s39_g37.t1
MKGSDNAPWRCRRCMQMRKATAQHCPICQMPWQACYDQTYVHKPRAQPQSDQQYSATWNGQSWDYQQWDSGNQTPRGKSPRSKQRPRSAKKQRGQDQWSNQWQNQTAQSQYLPSGAGKGSILPPPPPPEIPWMGQPMAMMPNMHPATMQSVNPQQPMMLGPVNQKGGKTVMAPMPQPMMTPAPQTMPVPTVTPMMPQSHGTMPPMQQPPLSMPPQPPEPDAQFWDYLKHRKSDLPPDVQQEITKREGARVSTDLFTAVQQMTDAREHYEQALLGRSQHLQAWKSFLAKAVTDWQNFAQQFIQHEQNLQQRIAITKEAFMRAKESVDLARKEAGEVVDLTEEEDPLAGTASTSSVDKVTASIENLTTSLQQLHSEAAALEAEVPPLAKRARVESPVKEDKDEGMDGSSKLSPALQPFGRAGQ